MTDAEEPLDKFVREVGEELLKLKASHDNLEQLLAAQVLMVQDIALTLEMVLNDLILDGDSEESKRQFLAKLNESRAQMVHNIGQLSSQLS